VTTWSNGGPWGDRSAEELLADMEATRAKIEALGPMPVRMRMPSTVWSALRAQVPAHEGAPSPLALPVEIDNELPSRTVRVIYSDGTEEDVRL
jgi:hypothetical protein